MIQIKQKPEDFKVKEILGEEIHKSMSAKEKGEYSYYKLTKINYNTVDAVMVIAKNWKLDTKTINFAGAKDKHAVTEQYISIWNGPKKDMYLDNITLHYLGQGNQRINLGCLEGNEFEIIVESDASSGQFPRAITKTINYFDDQRFGRNKDNHVVGKLLVQRKFKEVCELLAAHDGVSHNAMSHDVSKETDHETLQSRFVVQDNNYVGALRTIPRKVLQLYVHAYQSYLWNLVVDEYVRKNFRFYEIEYGLGKLAIPFVIGDLQQTKVPIIGFGTEFSSESTYQGKYDKLGAIVDVILEKEGITLRDFVIREIPEITNEGSERDMILVVDKLKVTELNRPSWLARLFAWLLHKPPQNFRKYKLAFTLGKGSYATLVVKDVFAAPIPISTNSAANEANNDAKHDTKPAAATSKEL